MPILVYWFLTDFKKFAQIWEKITEIHIEVTIGHFNGRHEETYLHIYTCILQQDIIIIGTRRHK